MPRGKKKNSQKTIDLIEAVRQISLCQKDTGNEMETHCSFSNGFITACDGNLAVGVFVPEDLNLRPHTHKLLLALEKCEEATTLTQTESKLSVRSGPFRALVPCLGVDLPQWMPDPIAGVATIELKEALNIAGMLVQDDLTKPIIESSILLQSSSVIGCNGKTIIEAWHGLHFPCEFLISHRFQVALSKTNKTPVSFGYSENSFTIFFEDKSWIKTQLLAGQWPDSPKQILSTPSSPGSIHPDFFKAASIVSEFSEHHDVYVQDNYIGSRPPLEGSDGAAYELKGDKLPKVHLDGEQLKLIDAYAISIDFTALNGRGLMFFGDGVRGAVSYRA